MLHFTRGILQFQKNTNNAKSSHISLQSQAPIENILSNFDPGNPLPRILPKWKTKNSKLSASLFYSSSWLTSPDAFSQLVANLESITKHQQSDIQGIDTAFEQSITFVVTSVVASALAGLHAKHDDDIQSLCKIFEKTLPTKDSCALSPDAQTPDVGEADNKSEAAFSPDLTSKGSQERWNQADLGYFDPYLDIKAHGLGEVVSIRKDTYYENAVLFVQKVQNLVTLKGATTVKANMGTLLFAYVLEWYTSEVSDFDHDEWNNELGIKSWINTLSQQFKIPTIVALGLLTDETYSLEDAWRRRPPAQYVQAIIRNGIRCNITEVINQLSFAYRGLSPKLRVFVAPTTESTRAVNFIRTLEEKQEVWYEMMTGPASQRPYAQSRAAYASSRFLFRPPLLSQSEARRSLVTRHNKPQFHLKPSLCYCIDQ